MLIIITVWKPISHHCHYAVRIINTNNTILVIIVIPTQLCKFLKFQKSLASNSFLRTKDISLTNYGNDRKIMVIRLHPKSSHLHKSLCTHRSGSRFLYPEILNGACTRCYTTIGTSLLSDFFFHMHLDNHM